ncbi:hypothetical protein JQ636_40545 [Bradyrhizobium japonicum]|uniref:hypothetical protein n=1 Tax=Bradyrhizobium japonicum TaxID=375 RepID=UPI001BA45ACE|nr:hypothetical protein [Bradyrhizobium japonicum]MBR0731090.1 hypothetical protein [Bradyrhizobium japonicum]MBR0809848.1 hypothetical protein [Bradyrhizobium japonicum]
MGLPDQVKLPYSEGYEIGLGVNFASGGPKNEAVVGAVTPPQIGQAAIVEHRVLRVHTTSEIEQLLEISANASYGVAAFVGVEGRFKFAKAAKVQSSSLVMMVVATVRRAFQQIDSVALTREASEVADQPDVFAERYGNMFVQGMSTGGLFAGYFRIDTGSTQLSDDISIKLSGSYGLFSRINGAALNDRGVRQGLVVAAIGETADVDDAVAFRAQPFHRAFMDGDSGLGGGIAQPIRGTASGYETLSDYCDA